MKMVPNDRDSGLTRSCLVNVLYRPGAEAFRFGIAFCMGSRKRNPITEYPTTI